MGCWSESCALSGLEIMLGESGVYVAMLKPSKYGDGMEISIPPVKGKYDDYGGIDLEEDCPLLELVTGENWRPREDEFLKFGRPVYINGAVFESLPQLKKEMNWRGATIAEGYQHHKDELEKQVKENMELLSEFMDDPAVTAYRDLKMSMLFGSANSVWPLARTLYKAGEDNSYFYKMHERAYVLQLAQHELRKLVVPGVGGPQHSGEVALRQFYTTVSDILDARIEEFKKDEFYEDDDPS